MIARLYEVEKQIPDYFDAFFLLSLFYYYLVNMVFLQKYIRHSASTFFIELARDYF